MNTSTAPETGSARSFSETEEATCRGLYGGRVFDGSLHSCGICGRNAAIAHSVRIRQDEPGTPLCVACRLEGAASAPDIDPAHHESDDAAPEVPSPPKRPARHPAGRRKGASPRAILRATPPPVFEGIERNGRALPSLGDLVFRRDAGKGIDVTASWCGDPPLWRSALGQLALARHSTSAPRQPIR